MTRGRDARRTVVAVRDGVPAPTVDRVAVEEPMEIRVDGVTVSVTMRTPGDDFDLAVGWCVAEGIVGPDDIRAARYCGSRGDDGLHTHNVVDVETRSGMPMPADRRRLHLSSSACGVCGTASIDEVRTRARSVHADETPVSADVLAALPERLRQAQRTFARTGGLHAAGLFTPAGDLVCAREDVGRHNAVDKLLGWAARTARLPLSGHILMVSGRAAFEIVQKALVASIPIVAAVSAPTSLAVELADESGCTLVGFVRGTTMNAYTHAGRITAAT